MVRTNIALDIFLEYKKVLYSSLNFLREKDGLHFLKGLVYLPMERCKCALVDQH